MLTARRQAYRQFLLLTGHELLHDSRVSIVLCVALCIQGIQWLLSTQDVTDGSWDHKRVPANEKGDAQAVASSGHVSNDVTGVARLVTADPYRAYHGTMVALQSMLVHVHTGFGPGVRGAGACGCP